MVRAEIFGRVNVEWDSYGGKEITMMLAVVISGSDQTVLSNGGRGGARGEAKE
jgi:hypothetical protein